MNNIVILNQRVLGRWRGAIDAADALIVAHIERLQTSRNPKVVARRVAGGFAWVDLESLLADNPIIGLGYEGLRTRLRKLRKIGVLERYLETVSGNRTRASTTQVCASTSAHPGRALRRGSA